MDKIISKQPTTQSIYETIKSRIVEMDYLPGFSLIEKDLSEEFGVSRTPIREALINLKADGLISIIPRQGTFVSQIDLHEVRNAFEVKKNLEGLAAELASQRATNDEIDELFEIIERFNKYDIKNDYKSCIKDDQRFHQIVRNASRNPILSNMLESLNTKTARFLQNISYVIDDYNWFNVSLKEMANAIKNRDKEASRIEAELHAKKILEELSKKFF
jgi:DNA-binding GntR family transcriptional regulator